MLSLDTTKETPSLSKMVNIKENRASPAFTAITMALDGVTCSISPFSPSRGWP